MKMTPSAKKGWRMSWLRHFNKNRNENNNINKNMIISAINSN